MSENKARWVTLHGWEPSARDAGCSRVPMPRQFRSSLVAGGRAGWESRSQQLRPPLPGLLLLHSRPAHGQGSAATPSLSQSSPQHPCAHMAGGAPHLVPWGPHRDAA